MKTQTRTLSITALSVAGAVVMLYMGRLFPAMALTFAALAALFVAATVIEGGLKYGLLCFVAASILGMLLAPGMTAILYLTFFGVYPLIKSIAERRKSQVLGWAIKLAAFFSALTCYVFIWQELFVGVIPFIDRALPIIYLAGLAVFMVYDIGLSKLIGFYLTRIYKYRNGR
ncbi:MAG: hypothetical protein FWE08_04645 [Oscillospiraceae bacterium]|nr:hypothetical protein [Oscillospiraceae bacterium]